MSGFLLQQFVNAVTIGALYALIALGYTMVYGTLKLINFAHGEMFTGGAYVALLLVTVLLAGTVDGIAAVLLVFTGSFLLIGVLGVLVERLAYKPLRGAPRLAPLLSALGVSIFLQQAILAIAGPEPVRFPDLIARETIVLGPVAFTNVNVIVLAIAVALLAGLLLFVNRTMLGIHIRAVAESLPTARLVGIRVERPIIVVFFIVATPE